MTCQWKPQITTLPSMLKIVRFPVFSPKNIWPTDILAGARTFSTTTLGKMTLTITTFSMMTFGIRIECHFAECHVFLFLGWTSLCWVSLCWMSWRNFDQQALVLHRHDCNLADSLSVGKSILMPSRPNVSRPKGFCPKVVEPISLYGEWEIPLKHWSYF